jgi:hypothetical protein
VNFPFQPPFIIQTLDNWVETIRPFSIYMTEKQYAHFATLCGLTNRIQGHPRRFLDAPFSV